MVELRHSPAVDGAFEADGYGPYTITDGRLEVDDADAAEYLVDTYPGKLSYADGGGSETCEETVQRTGDVCGRELPCPYHD